MGRDFVLIAFSVVIIGGMGSIKGAVIAGLLLTQVQSISSLVISRCGAIRCCSGSWCWC